MTSGDAATIRSATADRDSGGHRDDAQREERDGSDEQPDVERVEPAHEQRVEGEEHDLEDEHGNRDARERERRVDVGVVRDDLRSDMEPAPTPTREPNRMMCP